MFDQLEEKCGCGEDVRYSTLCGKGSCNKYHRCPSYKELQDRATDLGVLGRRYRHALEKIVRVNGMDYEYKAWAKEALPKEEK